MRRFARLIDDLYDAQLIAEGRNVMSLEAFDLGLLLLEQVDLFSGQGDAHALRLELPSRSLLVHADRERIARVVANLLSNAIKYSPGRRHDHRSPPNVQDGVVRVSVSDNGIGIPCDQQHRVFAKFFRADSSSSDIKGVGLGLSLCREIVHAHGGARRIRQHVRPGLDVLVRASGRLRLPKLEPRRPRVVRLWSPKGERPRRNARDQGIY